MSTFSIDADEKDTLENIEIKIQDIDEDMVYIYDKDMLGYTLYSDNGGDIYIYQLANPVKETFIIGYSQSIYSDIQTLTKSSGILPFIYYSYPFKNIYKTEIDLKLILDSYKTGNNFYYCPLQKLRELILNMQKDKDDVMLEYSPDIQQNVLYCSKCESTLSNNIDMQTHRRHCQEYNTKFITKDILNIKEYNCDYCNKPYRHRQSRSVHMKRCKYKGNQKQMVDFFKNQLTKKDEEIEQMKKQWALEREIVSTEMGKLVDKVGYVTNIENQHNINIHINNYGSENMDYIDTHFLQNLLNIPFGAVPKLLQNLHFHPNHPENHNIKITNKKLPYASIYSGSKWILKDKKEVIDSMVDKSYNLLDEHYVEGKKILYNPKIGKYKTFQANYNKQDKKLKRQLTKEVEMIILNESKL